MTVVPDPAAAKIYDQLYALYRQCHDAFGGVTITDAAGRTMNLKPNEFSQSAEVQDALKVLTADGKVEYVLNCICICDCRDSLAIG